MPAKHSTDAIENEKQGAARAKGEIKYANTKNDYTKKTLPAAQLKLAISQLYNDTATHPASSSFRMGLPSADNLESIDSASPQQLAQYNKMFAKRKADYEQQVKKIAPAATPTPAATAPAAQPKPVFPPASAVPTPSNSRATSAPVAAGTIERLGNRAKALSGYAEKSAGAAAALKAARDKLPATSRQKNQTQAAKPTDNTAASALNLLGMAASVGTGAPLGNLAAGAAMKMAQQQATQQPSTPSSKADALIQKFDNQTTQATKDANKAVQTQASQASQASSLNQLKPFDEVKAMEDQMRRGGYQIQEGGLKKDGAGYHVIDEQGRKLMVAPTAAMRFNVAEQANGMDKLSKTLKPGQTMTDKGRAYMGLPPQQTAQAGGVVTTDMRPVNTEQNPKGKVFMGALANELKQQTIREIESKSGGAPLDPRMQTREYAHAMAAAADAKSRQVQPAPLAASAPNPAGTTNRVLTDPKFGGSGVAYGTDARLAAQQMATREAASRAAAHTATLPTAESQAGVVKKYPEVGVAGNPINKLFTDEYHKDPQPNNAMAIADKMFGEGGSGSEAYKLAIKNRVTPPQPSTGNPAVVGTNSAGAAASPNVAAPTPDTFAGLTADQIVAQKDADFNKTQTDNALKTQAGIRDEEERVKKEGAIKYDPQAAANAKSKLINLGF